MPLTNLPAVAMCFYCFWSHSGNLIDDYLFNKTILYSNAKQPADGRHWRTQRRLGSEFRTQKFLSPNEANLTKLKKRLLHDGVLDQTPRTRSRIAKEHWRTSIVYGQ